MGGIPKDPKVIEGWLKTRLGLDDDELKATVIRTLRENGAEIPEGATLEEIQAAVDTVATERNTNGFKQNGAGLYLESRCVKAMFKEVTNQLFAGERWGKTQKGPKSFVSERVYVYPYHISLGIEEPDGAELFVGHVNGKGGQRSTLTYYQYAEKREIEIEIGVTNDAVKMKHWKEIWVQAQENGLGALRSQGFGQFDLVEWECI
jgi:hypothetical protein